MNILNPKAENTTYTQYFLQLLFSCSTTGNPQCCSPGKPRGLCVSIVFLDWHFFPNVKPKPVPSPQVCEKPRRTSFAAAHEALSIGFRQEKEILSRHHLVLHWKDDPWMLFILVERVIVFGSWVDVGSLIIGIIANLLRVVSMFVVSNVYVQKDGGKT